MVNPHSFVRRCNQCRHTGTEPLPRLRKKVIYLDQFAISYLAKAGQGSDTASQPSDWWRSLYSRIRGLVDLQLVACPVSEFHHTESMVSKIDEVLMGTARSLSAGVVFHDADAIRRGQLYLHARLWLQGRASEEPDLDVTRVIDDRVDGWQPRLQIEVKLDVPPDLIEDVRSLRGAFDEGLRSLWPRWRQEDLPFVQRFREEAMAYGPTILGMTLQHAQELHEMASGLAPFVPEAAMAPEAAVVLTSLRHAMEKRVSEKESLAKSIEYLTSEAMLRVPFNRISSLLYAALARKARAGQKRPPSQGMTTDIRMISALLPYCDAMFIDNEAHALLNEQPLRTEIDYGTQLFSLNTKERFVDYLKEIEDSATPEHLELVRAVYGDMLGR